MSEQQVFDLSAQQAKGMPISYGEVVRNDTSKAKNYMDLHPSEFMLETYECGEHYRNGTFLSPHTRESAYQTRIRQVYYENYLKPIADALILPVYSQPIKRETDDDQMVEILKDVTKTGKSINEFCKQVSIASCVMGTVFVCIDNESDIPETVGDAIKAGARPYAITRAASTVYSCEVDKFEKIISIMFIERKETRKDKSGNKREVTICTRYTKNTIETVEVSTKYKEVVDTIVGTPIVHGLGEVPVICYNSFGVGSELVKMSELYSIAVMNWTVFNLSSEIRALERGQTFSVFCIQTEGAGAIKIGVDNALIIPMSATMMPQFISPDAQQLKQLVDNKAALIDSIYRAASQSGVVGVATASSGVAKGWDFRALNEVLKSNSEKCESFEKKLVDMMFLFLGTTNDYECEYSDDFSPTSVTDAVQMSINAHGAMLPPVLLNIIDKNAAAVLAKDQEELQELCDILDGDLERDLATGRIDEEQTA